MRKYQLFILGMFLSAAIVFSQTLPPTLPSPDRPGYSGGGLRREPARRTSHVSGKDYTCVLDQPTAAREWQSSAPLPITLASAEKLCRAELSKLVPEEAGWIATDFQISRFSPGPSWYYAVTLTPALQITGERQESFTVLVDFSGTPGRVAQLGPHQVRR